MTDLIYRARNGEPVKLNVEAFDWMQGRPLRLRVNGREYRRRRSARVRRHKPKKEEE